MSLKVFHQQSPSSPIRTSSPTRRPNSPTAIPIPIHSPSPVSSKRTSARTRANSFASPQSKSFTTSRKNNLLSLLGIVIVFSVATNLFFGQTYQARHYGLGNKSRRSGGGGGEAWSPTKQDEKTRRVFRDGKLKRRQTGDERHVDNQRDAATSTTKNLDNRNHVGDVIMEHHKQRRSRPNSSHERIEKAVQTREYSAVQNKGQEPHDVQHHEVQPMKLLRGNITSHERRQRTHNTHEQMTTLKFIQHPFRKKRRSPPWTLSLPTPTEYIKLNDMVLLDGNQEQYKTTNSKANANLKGWLTPHDKPNNNSTEEDALAWKSQTVVWENDDECVPMSEWQTTFHPTCNSLHELDISLLLNNSAFSLVSSKGHWRNAWKVDVAVAEANGHVNVNASHFYTGAEISGKSHDKIANKYTVLKSLKYIHEPNEEVFELSRVDAVSLDVLTRSPFTINIFGYCGSSSIQEFAGGDLKGLLPKLDPLEKLRMAAWIAEGVADIHSVDDSLDRNNVVANNHTVDGNSTIFRKRNATQVPSLIHNDINMDNILLGHRNGVDVPILNDFNIAVFRKKNVHNGEPCRFRGRFANPQWMSPEQQERSEDELSTGYLNEKIDTYALGNILYKIAVGNSPWKYEYKVSRITPEIKAKIARAKLRGAKPKVPSDVRNITNPSITAVLTAMDRCYRNDAEIRLSARELANYLKSQLNEVELPIKVVDRFDLI